MTPTHYNSTTKTLVNLPAAHTAGTTVISDFPALPPEAHAANGYYLIRTDTARPADGNWTEDVEKRVVRLDGVYVDITRVWVAVPEPEPEVPPDAVLLAAMELQNAVTHIAQTYGVMLDLSSGYNETYSSIFGPESVIPEADRAGVWALVDTRYRNLDYHIQKWQAGTVTWDALPAIAAALANMQQ